MRMNETRVLMERVSTVVGSLKYLEDTMRFDGRDEFAETADDAKVCIRLLVMELHHTRDCLGSIRAHLVGQDSALAVAIRATCNAGLRETGP